MGARQDAGPSELRVKAKAHTLRHARQNGADLKNTEMSAWKAK